MKTILGIDPAAETSVSDTGWAYGRYTDTTPFELLDYGIVPGGFEGFCRELKIRLARSHQRTPLYEYGWNADVIVCEKFVKWNPAADVTPLLVEGVVRYEWPNVVLQPASGKNTLIPDNFLKTQGHWLPGGHHNDSREALRHIYVYLATHDHRPTLELLRV